ncbi:hypothetical protein HDU76_006247, partial [Blyttiomyces sp. JEL0837]
GKEEAFYWRHVDMNLAVGENAMIAWDGDMNDGSYFNSKLNGSGKDGIRKGKGGGTVGSASTAEATDGTLVLRSGVNYQLFNRPPESTKQEELARMQAMEKRITALERLIGRHELEEWDYESRSPGEDDGQGVVKSVLSATGTLMGAVEKLEHHFAILTQPRQLSNLSKRVRRVIGDMERLQDLKKRQTMDPFPYSKDFISAALSAVASGGVSGLLSPTTPTIPGVHGHGVFESGLAGLLGLTQGAGGSGPPPMQTDTERKVDQLFDRMERLDGTVTKVPHLVARLVTLRDVHAEAAVFCEQLRGVAEEQGKIGELTDGMAQALEQVEMGMLENDKVVRTNLEALMKRADKIMGILSGKAGGDSGSGVDNGVVDASAAAEANST